MVAIKRPRNDLLTEVAVKRELLRREYRTHLFGYTRDVLGYDRLDINVHGELCRRLEDAYWGRGQFAEDNEHIRRYLFLLPRGTYKTTIGTHSFIQWVLTQNDPPDLGQHALGWEPPQSFNGKPGYDQRILLGSYKEAKGVEMHGVIQSHLQRNNTLREFYGRLAPERRTQGVWTKHNSDILWRQDFRHRESNINVTALDMAMTGGHYTIFVGDDMIEEKHITNDEQIRQTIDWYRQLLPMRDPTVPFLVIFIGTRWHDKDLYGHFLNSPEEKGKWQVYIERAERTPEEIKAGKRKYFFPAELGESVLADLRTTMRPYRFSCQYYNDPIAATDAHFKPEYFDGAYYSFKDWKTKDRLQAWLAGLRIYTTIDPAHSKNGCYKVVTTWGWDVTGTGWCLDLWRDQEAHPAVWIGEAIRQFKVWRPMAVGVEQLELHQFAIDSVSQQHGVTPPWVELKSNLRKKELRILGLEPLARAGRLKLRHEHSVFEDEATRFPHGSFKDTLDAVAYQLDLTYVPMPTEDRGSERPQMDPISQRLSEQHLQRLERLKIRSYDSEDWYYG